MNTFTGISENNEPEGREIEAYDHENAAEIFAEWEDAQGDYMIIRGHDEVVEVRSEKGVTKKFRISGEVQNVYHARELE